MAQEYKPGEKAPVSGVYRVTHDHAHKQTHEDTMVKGHTFPPCAGCSGGATAIRFAELVFRRPLDMVDHENFDRPLVRRQLQSELLPNGRED